MLPKPKRCRAPLATALQKWPARDGSTDSVTRALCPFPRAHCGIDMGIRIILRWALVLAMTGICPGAAEPPSGPAADSKPGELLSREPAANGIWQGAVGEGFGRAAQSLSVEARGFVRVGRLWQSSAARPGTDEPELRSHIEPGQGPGPLVSRQLGVASRTVWRRAVFSGGRVGRGFDAAPAL